MTVASAHAHAATRVALATGRDEYGLRIVSLRPADPPRQPIRDVYLVLEHSFPRFEIDTEDSQARTECPADEQRPARQHPSFAQFLAGFQDWSQRPDFARACACDVDAVFVDAEPFVLRLHGWGPAAGEKCCLRGHGREGRCRRLRLLCLLVVLCQPHCADCGSARS